MKNQNKNANNPATAVLSVKKHKSSLFFGVFINKKRQWLLTTVFFE